MHPLSIRHCSWNYRARVGMIAKLIGNCSAVGLDITIPRIGVNDS